VHNRRDPAEETPQDSPGSPEESKRLNTARKVTKKGSFRFNSHRIAPGTPESDNSTGKQSTELRHFDHFDYGSSSGPGFSTSVGMNEDFTIDQTLFDFNHYPCCDFFPHEKESRAQKKISRGKN